MMHGVTILILFHGYYVSLLINWLGNYARFVDHLAVRNFAQDAPLGGGSRNLIYDHQDATYNDLYYY
jgi:hypothetical protein